MAFGIGPVVADLMIDWLCHIGTPSQPAETYYLQWHDGLPGTGGDNVCANLAARDALAGSSPWWETTATSGQAKNTTLGTSSAASGAATVSHFSVWSASTAGTCYGAGAVASPQTLESGGKVTYGAGDLILAITPAS